MYAVAPDCEPWHHVCMSDADAGARRQRIAALIKLRNKSVNAVAAEAGFREGTLRAYLKSDTRELSLANYEALAGALGVEPCELVFGVSPSQEITEQQHRLLALVPTMRPSQFSALWELVKEMGQPLAPSPLPDDQAPSGADPRKERKKRSTVP